MKEKELIEKIKLLKEIKPRKDWVLLAKDQILGQERRLDFSLFSNVFRLFLYSHYQLALASFLLLGILISGAFIFVQNSLPGDFLYSLKRISEKSQAVFVSPEDKPEVQLKLANKRLEELTKIAEKNDVKKLAPAISEFQASVSEAAQKLTKIQESGKTKEIWKKLIVEVKKLEENKEKIQSLGVVIGDTEEIKDAFCQLTEREIENLGTLTEKQLELLVEIEELLVEGKCSLAFEQILYLSYPQE